MSIASYLAGLLDAAGQVKASALGNVPAGNPSGLIAPYAGLTAPTGWLFCAGQAVSRTTYSSLFSALVTSSTVTVTIASPGVFTWNSHGLTVGTPVQLSTTGALPTGLTANTTYYVTATSLTTNTFTLSTTLGGAAINTSGTQSGTHTATVAPHGYGNGTTTFNLPDLRGRAPHGTDNMGGTAANRVTSGGSGIYGTAVGAVGGTETHTLTTAQIPSHQHNTFSNGYYWGAANSCMGTGGALTGAFNNGTLTGTAGGGGAHQNMSPTIMLNYIIKT